MRRRKDMRRRNGQPTTTQQQPHTPSKRGGTVHIRRCRATRDGAQPSRHRAPAASAVASMVGQRAEGSQLRIVARAEQ